MAVVFLCFVCCCCRLVVVAVVIVLLDVVVFVFGFILLLLLGCCFCVWGAGGDCCFGARGCFPVCSFCLLLFFMFMSGGLSSSNNLHGSHSIKIKLLAQDNMRVSFHVLVFCGAFNWVASF